MILDEILCRTRERADSLPDYGENPACPAEKPRLFEETIRRTQGRNAIIAEIKYSSPSSGVIRAGDSPEDLAVLMDKGGAVAISVLTEPCWFGGSVDTIRRVREVSDLPVLRKDFIIDERQIVESRRLGADALLLIAGVLRERLPAFVERCYAQSLEPLVEVHSLSEVPVVQQSGARLVGINNRDLKTMETSLSTTRILSRMFDRRETTLVSMSGFCWPHDVRSMRPYCDAFLIGRSIMASGKPGKVLEGFVFA